ASTEGRVVATGGVGDPPGDHRAEDSHRQGRDHDPGIGASGFGHFGLPRSSTRAASRISVGANSGGMGKVDPTSRGGWKAALTDGCKARIDTPTPSSPGSTAQGRSKKKAVTTARIGQTTRTPTRPPKMTRL